MLNESSNNLLLLAIMKIEFSIHEQCFPAFNASAILKLCHSKRSTNLHIFQRVKFIQLICNSNPASLDSGNFSSRLCGTRTAKTAALCNLLDIQWHNGRISWHKLQKRVLTMQPVSSIIPIDHEAETDATCTFELK
jgi:hypothetical protein